MSGFKELLKKPAFYRRIAMIVMVLMIVIRPTLFPENTKVELSNLNIWFAVDATGSMVAKDVQNGNVRRFEKAQTDVTELITKLPGAKYAVLVQDYSSYTASPMSTNADAAIAAEVYLRPKYSLYAQPTNLSELLEYLAGSIEHYKQRYPERSNVVVFMSDGEDVSGNILSIPGKLAGLIDGAVALGYGSTNGSPIEEVESFFNGSDISSDRFVTHYGNDDRVSVDSNYRVISKINENNLKKIASGIHASYYHRENGDMPAAVINDFNRIAMLNPTASSDKDASVYSETYWLFAIILLFLILWEGEDTLARLLSEQENKHA